MNAQQLKNSILQMAVQGKLVPQDPNDEPASVLLERIRAEKEKLIKEGKIKKEKNPSYIFRGEDNLPYEKVGKNEQKCIAEEIPCDIPDTWEWVRLASINEMFTGNSINEAEKKLKYTGLSEGRYYIGTKDVSFSHQIDYDNGVRIPFSNDKFRIAPKDSILMCIEGGSAGRKIAFTNQDVCFGNKLCCFVPLGINPMYLYYYLQSPIYQSAFKDNTSGIIGGVSVNVLKKMFLPVPPLAEQHRIVSEIGKIIPFIEQYNDKETELSGLSESFPRKLKQSILQQAVMGKLVTQDNEDESASIFIDRIIAENDYIIKPGKKKKDKNKPTIYIKEDSYYEKTNGIELCIDDEIPFEIPTSWSWTRIGHIFNVTKLAGFEYTKYFKKENVTKENMVPIVRARNVKMNRFIDNIDERISIELSTLLERSALTKDCLLMTFIGAGIGDVCIFNAFNRHHLAPNVAKIEPNDISIDLKYALYWLMSPVGQKNIESIKKSVAQPSLSMDTIRSILIAVPPINEQRRIVSYLDRILPLCEDLLI